MHISGYLNPESLLTLELTLKSLERAYIGQARGTALNPPRSDLYLPGIREGSTSAFKTMEGRLTESKIVALRLNRTPFAGRSGKIAW